MRTMYSKPKKYLWAIAAVTFLVLFLYIDFQLKASILQLSKSKVQLQGTEILNRIVNEQVVSQVKYEDIVAVYKDKEGKIEMIQPNTVELNRVISSTIAGVSRSLMQMKDDSIEVPMGQLSGLRILAAWGPEVQVRIIPTSEVHVDLLNKFEDAGINQTRHLIYMNINTTMRVAVPYLSDEVNVSSTVPLAETIIVGQVPQNYVNFQGQNSDLYRFSQGK
ncbi:MAG TPA: sporulation protein YunB [Syntrophomonadaceae bacterium]|nr:sporulation protein YunB [Syntrophomonadaceae bacterium]